MNKVWVFVCMFCLFMLYRLFEWLLMIIAPYLGLIIIAGLILLCVVSHRLNVNKQKGVPPEI